VYSRKTPHSAGERNVLNLISQNSFNALLQGGG
jgi:hypothetical protein